MHLRLYTTDTAARASEGGCFGVFTDWVTRYGIQAVATMVEVNFLAFKGLKVEVEAAATAVR